MRKRILLAMLAIPVFFSAPLCAQPGSTDSGSGKDINGIYKNEKFELKIENFNQQTNSFSFTLNSVKGNSSCDLALQGTANRLKINYPSPDKVRYEYISADACKYFFTVFTMEKTEVDIMRYGCNDNAMNSCLPEQTSSRMSCESKQ